MGAESATVALVLLRIFSTSTGPESHEISKEYVKRAVPILHRRLVQAGVRLHSLSLAVNGQLKAIEINPR